jgi:alpha-mannosidase
MPGRDGAVMLRIYEASGKPASGVAIRLHVPLGSASETNLLGDGGRPLAIADNTVHVDLRAYEIKTLELKLRASDTGK